MPPNTIYVGRGSRWGNPFPARRIILSAEQGGRDAIYETTPQESVCMFRHWLEATAVGRHRAASARRDLRGKNLACWCPLGQPCHADVLLEIANAAEACPPGREREAG